MNAPPHRAAVAIIDIGSNSIKSLVAARAADGGIVALRQRSIDARISAGISQAKPRLTGESMARGLDAIQTLLADAAEFSPVRTVLVATSAVRDAENGGEFRAHVRAATGHDIRILSGDEEANLIGSGLTSDPALFRLRDFYVFDLGGGSLECLAFRERKIEQAKSLQLGCVRLTEEFVPDPALPISPLALERVMSRTRDGLARSGFVFSLPATAAAVGTGGTVTTVRAILGARLGKGVEETAPRVEVAQLREMLAWLGGLSLAERKKVAGLPPPRADVFPIALATLIAVAETGGFAVFQHSLHNLRWGLAAEALD